MSATVVLSVPWRARKTRVASTTRSRWGESWLAGSAGAAGAGDAPASTTRSDAPRFPTVDTLGRLLSHCQRAATHRRPGSGARSSVVRTGHHPGEQLRADQLGHLRPVVEVPSPRGRHVGEDHTGQEVGGLHQVDPIDDTALVEIGNEEVGDAPSDAIALDRETGEELLRLSLHHQLEDLVLDDGPVGEHDAPLHHLLEAVGPLDLLVQEGE